MDKEMGFIITNNSGLFMLYKNRRRSFVASEIDYLIGRGVNISCENGIPENWQIISTFTGAFDAAEANRVRNEYPEIWV